MACKARAIAPFGGAWRAQAKPVGKAMIRVAPSLAAITIGVLLPVPGTWRLFLQMKAAGRIVTAPYTLNVS